MGGGGRSDVVLAFKQKVGDINLRWCIWCFIKFFKNDFVVGKIVMYMYNGNVSQISPSLENGLCRIILLSKKRLLLCTHSVMIIAYFLKKEKRKRLNQLFL